MPWRMLVATWLVVGAVFTACGPAGAATLQEEAWQQKMDAAL